MKTKGRQQDSQNQLRSSMMYFISQVDGVEINMDDFLLDTFDNWSNKMKRYGEFADHIAVQATARKLKTDKETSMSILFMTKSIKLAFLKQYLIIKLSQKITQYNKNADTKFMRTTRFWNNLHQTRYAQSRNI
jgi:hypothetical protein